MRELREQLEALRATDRAAVAATLIATSGPSPRRVGARLWIGASGRAIGSVSVGGCIDTRVLEAAPDVLRTNAPRILTIDMGDPSLDLGFTCAGKLDVLMEPFSFEDPHDALMEAYVVGYACVAQRAGAVRLRRLAGDYDHMLLCSDGSSRGTLGATDLDDIARGLAHSLLEMGVSRIVKLGEVDVFAEVLSTAPRLIVLGAGPVAAPLLQLARALSWDSTVVDPRAHVANAESLPAADVIQIGDPAAFAATIVDGQSTAVVLLAHDYKYDLPVLRAVLQTDAAYIGMLGSRRRGRALIEFLADEGVTAEQLQRIRVPVGLDLGADSPAELALSVLSEAMAVLRGRGGTSLSSGR